MSEEIKNEQNAECGSCVCMGAGPAMSDMLRKMGPPEEARRHFDSARVEFLKGLRALIDSRIAHFDKRHAKGEKITVE